MKRFLLSLLLLLGIVPLVASADDAYLSSRANLRTGPDAGYPTIVTISAGARVDIYGCIDDWSWCDVGWRGERGWVYGELLDYSYQGQRYDIYHYGPQLGLPILSFVLGSYWDNHYRGRRWYGERSRWSQHRRVHRPRPAQPPRRIHGRSTSKSPALGRTTNRSAVKPGVRSTNRSAVKPGVRSTNRSAVKPGARSSTRSAAQPGARSSTRSAAQPGARSTTRSAVKPGARSTGKAAAKPASKAAGRSTDKKKGEKDEDDRRR